MKCLGMIVSAKSSALLLTAIWAGELSWSVQVTCLFWVIRRWSLSRSMAMDSVQAMEIFGAVWSEEVTGVVWAAELV